MIQWQLLDTVNSSCSLSVLLSAMEMRRLTWTALVLGWWPSSEIIHIHLDIQCNSHSYCSRVAFSLLRAPYCAATIRGWCLFGEIWYLILSLVGVQQYNTSNTGMWSKYTTEWSSISTLDTYMCVMESENVDSCVWMRSWQLCRHVHECHLPSTPHHLLSPKHVHTQVIMATNRSDTLDPALLRPGRLDRKIEFPMPDRRQKRLIFSTITSKMNLSEEVDLEDCIP